MIKTTVKVEGLKELNAALMELPKATARNTLRRVLNKRAQPVADAMRSNVPFKSGDLKKSIRVGTKLSRRQGRAHRREHRDDKAFAEVFVGAGPDPAAHLTEYGGPTNAPVGWGRAAWDATQNGVLEGFKDDLWKEIDKAAKRLARKAAKAAARG